MGKCKSAGDTADVSDERYGDGKCTDPDHTVDEALL